VTAHKAELDKSDAEYESAADEKEKAINTVLQEAHQRGISDPHKHSTFSANDIAGIRKNLKDALERRRVAYSEEVRRQTAAEGLRKEFADKSNTFVGALAGEKSTLDTLEGDAEEKITRIKEVHKEGAKGAEHIKGLSHLSDQMKSEGIYGNTHTKHTLPSLVSKNNQHNLHVASSIAALMEEKEIQDRIASQETELKEAEKRENMVLQFSAKARDLNAWMENADESFNDPINASGLYDAEKLVAEYNAIAAELKNKEQDHSNLQDLVKEMKAAGVTDFSGVTIEEINEKWNTTKSLAAERNAALQKELQRQKNNDALCAKFAGKAKELSTWTQGTKNELAAAKGELEQQLDSLQGLRNKFADKHVALGELETLHKEIEAAGIHRNPHTDISLRTLQSEYEQLGAAMAKQETLLTKKLCQRRTPILLQSN